MKKMDKRVVILFVLLPLMIWQCRKVAQPTEVDMSEYGWILYEEGKQNPVKYVQSNEWFINAVFEDTTYKDGYNGQGWTYGKIGEIDSSISIFARGREYALSDTTDRDLNLLLSDPPHDPVKECTAGLSLAYHASGDYQRAVNFGLEMLTIVGDSSYAVTKGSPKWVFSRDISINSKHIIWTIASSYFATGEFKLSLKYTQRLMSIPSDLTFANPDAPTVEELRLLVEKIEFLRGNL